MPWPTSPAIGDVYQPEPPDGISYIYRGNGRWDVLIQPSAASLAGYYTKGQIDSLLENVSSELEEAIEGLEEEYVPLAQRGAADGVAMLDGGGKVPTSQLALTKSDVGLESVDNTSDLDKPISSAVQAALDLKSGVGHGHPMSLIVGLDAALGAKQDAAGYTPADVLDKLLEVDGPASGLNADLLDGHHAVAFVRTVNAMSPDGGGNVTVGAGRLKHVVTSGNGNQTAPAGDTYWNGSVAPTTAMRRRIDDVTLAHTAQVNGGRLKISYQAAFETVKSTDDYPDSGDPDVSMALALFRDAEANAIDWIPLRGPSASPLVNVSFLIVAPDNASHTYRVAIISGAAGTSPAVDVHDAGELTRRTFLIEEFSPT